MGIVITKQGKGSFVSPSINEGIKSSLFPIVNLTEKELMGILELRETFEFKFIELVTLRANEEDFARIQEALDMMIACQNDYRKYTQADYQFHLSIAKATGNEIFYNIILAFKDTFYNFLEELNRVLGVNTSPHGHSQLLEALKSRDAQRAKKMVKKGLEESRAGIKKRLDSQ